MHKQMLIRHLGVALLAQNRAIRVSQDKYGDNHIMTTTLKMEAKELADYIYSLENERQEDKKKGA